MYPVTFFFKGIAVKVPSLLRECWIVWQDVMEGARGCTYRVCPVILFSSHFFCVSLTFSIDVARIYEVLSRLGFLEGVVMMLKWVSLWWEMIRKCVQLWPCCVFYTNVGVCHFVVTCYLFYSIQIKWTYRSLISRTALIFFFLDNFTLLCLSRRVSLASGWAQFFPWHIVFLLSHIYSLP